MTSKLYLNYTLVNLIKGHFLTSDAPNLVAPLARRVADLEHKARMVHRADGTVAACHSIEEADLLRKQAAERAGRALPADWHTNAMVPPPAMDRPIIAVLYSGRVLSGVIKVCGDVLGGVELVTETDGAIVWEEVAAWTAKPGGL